MLFLYITLLSAASQLVYTINNNILSQNLTNTTSTPSLPPNDANFDIDAAYTDVNLSSKTRLIVSFIHRVTAVPFDNIKPESQPRHERSSKSVLVKTLKHLDIYVIEMGEGYSKEQISQFATFLINEGGTVEFDKVAYVTAASISPDNIKDRNTILASADAPSGNATDTFLPNSEQWYMELLHISKAQSRLQRVKTKRVKVCIVDTGVDYRHAALRGRMYLNLEEAGGTKGVDDDNNGVVDDAYGVNFLDDNEDPMDFQGHGTQLAGIIAGSAHLSKHIVGINSLARIIACKAFDNNMKGRMSNILKCIDYCIARGAAIQNHSWSIAEESPSLMGAFSVAERSNVLMVVSAGSVLSKASRRKNIDRNVVIPATYSLYFSNMLTVSGMQTCSNEALKVRREKCILKNDPLLCDAKEFSKYELFDRSQYGTVLCHLVSPATDIYTITINNAIAKVEGTSMAAAIMTAVSSLILSMDIMNVSITARDTILFIKNSIVPLQSVQNKVRWGGYVDCHAAITKVNMFYKAIRERERMLHIRPTEKAPPTEVNLIL